MGHPGSPGKMSVKTEGGVQLPKTSVIHCDCVSDCPSLFLTGISCPWHTVQSPSAGASRSL